jgi:hypothetical protein
VLVFTHHRYRRALPKAVVKPSDKITVDKVALNNLGKIGITRQLIFEAIKDVSIPETDGCWSGATGNFDGQLVSVGVMQWNYGKNSLQPALKKFKASFPSNESFIKRRDQFMPNYGRQIFSDDCLRAKITSDCRETILALQKNGELQPALRSEFNALFESDEMIQIQVDRFVAMLESVKDDLLRMFDNKTPTVRKIKWAIDTKVQQGGFPGNEDIARVRTGWAQVKTEDKINKLRRIVQWYEAMANAVDQDGIKLDWQWNVEKWRQKISAGLTDEQVDLMNLTYLRSRTSVGESGRWQALTFQRRAKIILGIGSVGGNRVGN